MQNLVFPRNGRGIAGAFCAALGTLLVMGGGGVMQTAHAQAANAPTTFGSVNIDQVLAESKARQKDLAELNTLLLGLRKVNNTLTQGSAAFLNETEFKKLAALYEKDVPSATEKKDIAQLEQTGDTRKAELGRLESTPQPSDEQRRRFTELGAMRQQGDQNLQGLGEEYQARLRKREEDLTTKTIAVIKEAIAGVAKGKNLGVVFDSKVAVYTANDITADVVKQINK